MMNFTQYQTIIKALEDMDILQLQNLIIVATAIKDTKKKMYYRDVEELQKMIDRIRANYSDRYLCITTDIENRDEEIDIIQSKNIFITTPNIM
jgi:hypothetical protein